MSDREFSLDAVAKRLVAALAEDPMLLTHARAVGMKFAAEQGFIDAIARCGHPAAERIAVNMFVMEGDRITGYANDRVCNRQ